MADHPIYRMVVVPPVPSGFLEWFPLLRLQKSGEYVLIEGPVTDACQLAGIISSICHRNGNILSVELVDRPDSVSDSGLSRGD